MSKLFSKGADLFVGDRWGRIFVLRGDVTISAAVFTLYAEESTTDVLSTYATGGGSVSNNQITTPIVGHDGSSTDILPGKYELHCRVTYNGGLKTTIVTKFEFLEEKG